MSTTTTPRPPNLLSRDEDCLFKTALAFVVLRNRFKKNEKKRDDNDDQCDDAITPRRSNHVSPEFLRGMLSPTSSRSIQQTTTDEVHLERMMNVAISTAEGLYKTVRDETTTMSNHNPWVYRFDFYNASTPPQDMHNEETKKIFSTLDGLTNHLSSQFRAARAVNTTDSVDWMETFVQKNLLRFAQEQQEPIEMILASCTVLHGILAWGSSASNHLLAKATMSVIGRILQAMYKNELEALVKNTIEDEIKSDCHYDETSSPMIADVLAVNLIHLLEELVTLRKSSFNRQSNDTLLQELQDCLGSNDGGECSDVLFLPVPVSDLAYFLYKKQQQQQENDNGYQLTPGAKLMMRQCLWDLIQNASSY